MPRMKFDFTLIFDIADAPSVIFHRVQSASVPAVNFDTQILNQYNQKRVIQTGMNYDPMTVVFYDTYDNQFHDIMKKYIAHYYNGGEGIGDRVLTSNGSVINEDFSIDSGFSPNGVKNFFPRIRLIQNGYRDKYRTTSLINPLITGINGDTLSYSDGSSVVSYTATFQPETIQTFETNSQFDDGI